MKNWGIHLGLVLTLVAFNNCYSSFHAVEGGLNSNLSSELPDDGNSPFPPPGGSLPPPASSPPPPPDIDIDYQNTPVGKIAAQMAPGTWYEIPGQNKISAVFPSRDGHPAWGSQGPITVVNNWSGGVVARERFYVWGGGHADYGGNEVYAFNMETFTWERLTNPSAYKPGCTNVCVTVDGTPTSVHSYDGIEYLPNVGKLWMGSGAAWISGSYSPDSFYFDMQTKSWQRGPVKVVLVSWPLITIPLPGIY